MEEDKSELDLLGVALWSFSTWEILRIRFQCCPSKLWSIGKESPTPSCKGMDQFLSGGVLNDNLATFNVTAEGAAEALFLPALSVQVN